MATNKTNPKAGKKSAITKNEIISLFMLIRDAKNGNINRDALIKYIMLRVKLKGLYDEYEKVRHEISEQTKPDGWQEGDSPDEWNESFRPVMEAWLNETVEIETKIFTEEDCADFIISNPDQPGTFVDVVMECLKM